MHGGKNSKYINLIIHDCRQGISSWKGEIKPEIYGCIIYNNGWLGTDRGHGHCIYTQNEDGGWRYQPQRHEADISVTICQVMALRAARNAGLAVSRETIDRCIDYVKRCQNADGGFMYTLSGKDPSAFPRSAAGVVALYSAGVYEGPEIDQGLQYLMQHVPRGAGSGGQSHFFYAHHYAVQAMWQAGGEYWANWYPAIRDELTQWPGDYLQQEDGSWTSPICAEYATAMALIVLQLSENCLPIFQR